MKKWVKIILGVFGGLLGLLLAAAGGYIAYMQANYYRIEDETLLETENNRQEKADSSRTFTIATYNIGFGAYEPDYTFFMDTGKMKDGTPTQGKHSRALSEENCRRNTEGSIALLQSLNCDFYFVQEADEKATRSYSIDQVNMIRNAMASYGSVFTNAFHTPYLMYPLTEPHGSVESGLVTLSRYQIGANTRYQLPVSTAFITKFTDLDRCFTASRLELENGRSLVLVNLHLSAYDEGGTIRQQQMERLRSFLAEEYEKGNYVIAGGDFNHDIAGTISQFPSEQEIPEWVYQLSDKDLPSGFSFVIPDNVSEVPSCRGADVPYKKGVDYTVTVDGFLVSANITASSRVIENEFAYSDHQPVVMTFTLKEN